MKRVFVNFFMTLTLITLISNNCFSQVNKSEGFTKLVLLKGKVVDKNGHGVPMVMILVYGTTLGGLSRQDGSFEFSVPEDQPFGLLCWHPNYIHETFPVDNDNKSNFTITLTEDVNTIDFINKSLIRSQHKIDQGRGNLSALLTGRIYRSRPWLPSTRHVLKNVQRNNSSGQGKYC